MSENLFVTSEPNERSSFVMAIVHAVHDDGVQLLFFGEKVPAETHYKSLQSASIAELDRVLCVKVSGTYVVLGAIGAPSSAFHHGDKISFFGQPPIERITNVSSVATNATLAKVITQFNNLVMALDYRGYGLIA